MAVATIDITIPVLNEERCLRQSVAVLSDRLDAQCPYAWTITIADNGSTDDTWSVAQALAEDNRRVRAIRLDRRGRGRALKEAWSTSSADVVAYMDVDLSTGLESLSDLIDPLIAGTVDVSIGSRLAHGAQIRRSARREVISRIYNTITRVAFHFPVRDAQCGFKAARRQAAVQLLPCIVDDGWFFDTELIVLAWRSGMRINEVPVRWIEDSDSRVKIVRTATDDLKGIGRLLRDRLRQWSSGSGGGQVGTVVHVLPSRSPDGDWPMRDFDRFADGYVDHVDQSVSFTGKDSSFFARRKVEILEDLARASVGDLGTLSLLDVGCGTGTTDRFLVDHVGSLWGVDVSQEMLTLAAKHVPRGSFEWYNGEKLPFPDGSFDVSIAVCVLHHVPLSARAKFVAELHRVTRHKGLVAVFEHNPLNPLTRHAVNSCELDDGVVLVRGREAAVLMQTAGASDVVRSNYLFTPFGGSVGRAVDRSMTRLPLGGQYVVSARASHPTSTEGASGQTVP
jgi:SAM-dependent methyltransferase/glycosyltransferase involved in cell wall biosynthesis